MSRRIRKIRLLACGVLTCIAPACGWLGLGDGKALGNRLYLMEGDHPREGVIVYCSQPEFGECFAGLPMVPTYDQQFDQKGNYAEYVESAAAQGPWVLVRTQLVSSQAYRYWLIRNDRDLDLYRVNCARLNCDSLLQAHVIGPLNQARFTAKRTALGLDAPFD